MGFDVYFACVLATSAEGNLKSFFWEVSLDALTPFENNDGVVFF
jgi:hypothetical protein